MWKPCFFAMILVACGISLVFAEQAPKVDFVREIQPLFRAHCTGCHGAKQAAERLPT